MQSDSPLAPLLRAHAARLAREAAHVPLHPVAQLLLSAAQSARPDTYRHAVAAMALAGALAAAHGAMHRPFGHLMHASVALRAVPGEFDLHWVGRVTGAANEQPPLQPVMEPNDIHARLGALDAVLRAAERNVAALAVRAKAPTMKGALALAGFMVERLRAGWNESGLWCLHVPAGAEAAEVEALEDAIYFRLRAVQRAMLLHAGELPANEAAALQALGESLAMG